jgi:RNA 2',3'-cyclic 3'-phosphodiesterase
MRLFTGIALPARVLNNVAGVLKQLRSLAPLNWSPVENLHITTKFIGEWQEDRLMELEEALENLNPPGGFEIRIADFGYFPNPHHPRTLFAGVYSGPALPELATAIDEALRPLGVASESRPYSPHLTLARINKENIRELREHMAIMTNLDFGTFQVSEFHLYLSVPNRGRQGAVYTPLTTYPLRSAARVKVDSQVGCQVGSQEGSQE